MDRQNLVDALQAEIDKEDRPPEEKIFIRLLQEVWQVDWTVAPYDVWTRMIEWDVPYFLRFMGMDEGDEEQEEQLIQDWIASRTQLRAKNTGQDWRRRVSALIDEVNHVRVRVRQDA
ncbi:hypothetical protein SD80_000085 [Scytonema tolypothrichoides VB-61278]|nr:hypothetical protein SD80_000085 [Scytonema tolypothrichoides VB-61278]